MIMRIHALLGVGLVVVSGGSFGYAAWSEESGDLADQASAKADVRRALIADYERAPGAFRGEKLLAVGISYAREEMYDRARPVYECYLKLNPHNPRALRGLGIVCQSQGYYGEATNYLRQAWALRDVKSLPSLAYAYLKLRDYAALEGLIPDLAQQKSQNPEIVNCILAYVLDRSGNLKEPLNTRLLLEALEGLPDKDFARREDTARILSEVDRRLEAHPELWAARSAMLAKIVRGYEEDPPNWPKARRIAVADAYGILQCYPKAEPIYREILKEKTDDVDALRGLGRVLGNQSRWSEAVETLRKAWSLRDRDSLMALAAVYVGAKEYAGMRDLMPSLLERRREDVTLARFAMIYALSRDPADRTLFYGAMDGWTDEELARETDTAQVAAAGLILFGEKDRADRLLKLRAEHAKPKKA